MPLPTCICVAGRPPFDRLGDIFCALAQIDRECVVPTLLSATIDITGGFITLVFDEEVTGTGAGFLLNLDSFSSSLTYVSGNGTETLVFSLSPAALPGETGLLDYGGNDVTSGDCLLEMFTNFPVTNNTEGPPTPLTSIDITDPANIASFTRPGAAGFSGNGETAFQREAASNVLRSSHYVSGEQCVLLENTPTACALVAPGTPSVTPGTLGFTATFTAIAVTASLLRYEYKITGEVVWVDNGTSLSITGTSAAGSQTLEVRAVSTSGAVGTIATSASFTIEAAPAVTAAAINTAGTTLTLTTNKNVSAGAGGSAGFAITSSVAAVTATYSSGLGTTSLVYTLSRTVDSTETLTLAYTQPGNGLEDSNGYDMASFSGTAITNNSTVPGYLTNEGAEGTGTPSGWTDTGNSSLTNWDYSAAPLVGSHSLRLLATAQIATTLSPSWNADQNTAECYFQFRSATLPITGVIWFRFLDSTAATIIASIEFQAGGVIRVRHGSTNATTVSAMSANTTYHVWVRYVKGTGANGVASVAFSTNGVRPLSGNAFAQTTTGTSTLPARKIRLGHTANSTYDIIFDRILASATTIGDNP